MGTEQTGLRDVKQEPSRDMRPASREVVWANLDDTGRDFFKALNEQFSITFESGCVRED